VPAAMVAGFEAAEGDLAQRLMAALDAAEGEGGDVRGRQSAALVVVPREGEPWQARFDLRVEDHREPVQELRRVLTLARAYELAGEADELMASDRAGEAGPLYERAAALAPESDELLFWAGLAQAHAGDAERGIAAVRRAIEIHPGWRDLLDRLSPDFAPAGERVRRELDSSWWALPQRHERTH
jgi:tetratricopeptide (TPR) repeat protein